MRSEIIKKYLSYFITFMYIFFISIHVYGSPSPKKIMFVLQTESIGGKGVYELYKEMKKVGHDVKIIAIPLYCNKKLLASVDIEFSKKFDEKDIIYPCGKNPPYHKCENIEKYKADYIFTQNPYDSYANSILDPYFLISNLKKNSKKLMFIVYGPHLFHQDFIDDTKLKNIVDVAFVDSESTKYIYVTKYQFPQNRVVVSGYPSYKETRDRMQTEPKQKRKETILWLPRWFLSFRAKDLFEGGSTFLNYYHFFYNFSKQHPEINFIIRPHILLFTYPVDSNFLSQADLDEIFQKFRTLSNVTISMHEDRSLVDDIIASDVVISDGTSALAEVVVADKPIIYLSNGWNNEFNSNSNKLSNEFKKYIYFAYEPNDITNHLEYIRNNNYLPFTEKNDNLKNTLKYTLKYIKSKLLFQTCQREEFKKLLDPVENPAQFIAEYLLQD
jgi:hypothetical protein